MKNLIFKNIELEKWIPRDKVTYFLVAEEEQVEELSESFENFNIRFLSWNENISSKEISEIESLAIWEPETEEYEITELPQWLQSIKNLKILSLPYVCIPYLMKMITGSSETLQTLNLFNPIEWDNEKIVFPKSLDFPNLSAFISNCEINGLFGITAKQMPNLSFLKSNLKKYDDIAQLAEINNFKKLQHVRFEHGKSLDILSVISPDHLKSLGLINFKGNSFLTSRLKNFYGLEFIHLNGITKSPIDCSIFVTIKNLIYLDLISCFNLQNTDSLLNLNNLSHLKVLDCKNPLSEKTKHLLQNQNLSFLSIDYA